MTDRFCTYTPRKTPFVTVLSGAKTSFHSVINPAATSFELEHYFAIAEPHVVAVDASQVHKVEKALKGFKGRSSPEIVLVDDGSNATNASELPLVRSTRLHTGTD